MKRYRILKFYLDATRGIFRNYSNPGVAMAVAKKEMEGSLKADYGEFNFDEKFRRYMELEKPVLSIVEEHSQLLEDICNSYVSGYFYSALTGACCLGERIFNSVIFKVMDDFKSSPWYKKIYNKRSIIDWELAIQILTDWQIVDEELCRKYLKLMRLRHESIHYQKKEQDAEKMSLEATNLVNFIILRLFGINERRKDILLYFDVPGEIFIRKDAEKISLVKVFYIPCGVLVGPRYEVDNNSASGKFTISDNHTYENKKITDLEFVKLRNEYISKSS